MTSIIKEVESAREGSGMEEVKDRIVGMRTCSIRWASSHSLSLSRASCRASSTCKVKKQSSK